MTVWSKPIDDFENEEQELAVAKQNLMSEPARADFTFSKLPLGIQPVDFMKTHFAETAGKSMQFRKGTTTLAFVYEPATPNDKGGIIVAVDSRASSGEYISSKSVMKILDIGDRMVATMAGGAADCQFWTRIVAKYCTLYELREKNSITVSAASKYFANVLYGYRGQGSMVAGYDKKGPQIFGNQDYPHHTIVMSNGTGSKGSLSVSNSTPSSSSKGDGNGKKSSNNKSNGKNPSQISQSYYGYLLGTVKLPDFSSKFLMENDLVQFVIEVDYVGKKKSNHVAFSAEFCNGNMKSKIFMKTRGTSGQTVQLEGVSRLPMPGLWKIQLYFQNHFFGEFEIQVQTKTVVYIPTTPTGNTTSIIIGGADSDKYCIIKQDVSYDLQNAPMVRVKDTHALQTLINKRYTMIAPPLDHYIGSFTLQCKTDGMMYAGEYEICQYSIVDGGRLYDTVEMAECASSLPTMMP